MSAIIRFIKVCVAFTILFVACLIPAAIEFASIKFVVPYYSGDPSGSSCIIGFIVTGIALAIWLVCLAATICPSSNNGGIYAPPKVKK